VHLPQLAVSVSASDAIQIIKCTQTNESWNQRTEAKADRNIFASSSHIASKRNLGQNTADVQSINAEQDVAWRIDRK
jgi:hypothetical protein